MILIPILLMCFIFSVFTNFTVCVFMAIIVSISSFAVFEKVILSVALLILIIAVSYLFKCIKITYLRGR